VILPTYNEAENVTDVIPKIFAQVPAIPTHDLHVIVVDDNSPDGTQHVIRTLMERFQNLHLITGPKRGLGEAYKRGIDFATKRLSPDIVFEMDADGQHDPGLIPLFVYLSDHGFSLVIGSRFAPGGSTPDFSKGRRIMSLVGSWMIRFLGGLPKIHDCTSGFRCIKAEVLKKCDFRFLSTRGYSFQSSVLWELLRHGARVIEVPMTFRCRTHGESKLTLRDQVEFLINVVKLRFRRFEEFIRFALVGLSGLLVNLGSYVLLTRKMGFNIALACPIAIELSILSNYFLNDVWTFKYRRVTIPVYRRLFRFHTAAALAGSLNYTVFLTLVYLTHVNDILSNVIGISIGMLINYSLNSIWTWHQSRPMFDSTIGRPRSPNCHKGQSCMKQR
jgi:dolichol-phosphate mannosyltransferase